MTFDVIVKPWNERLAIRVDFERPATAIEYVKRP
jgi:hypothetical protein